MTVGRVGVGGHARKGGALPGSATEFKKGALRSEHGLCPRPLVQIKAPQPKFLSFNPWKLELRGDIPASHMATRSTTPLLRNPTDVRHCSQHAGANVDFGDQGAVDWAFLGNLKQLRALLFG